MTTEVELKTEELKAKMRVACDTNDVKAMELLAGQIVSSVKERAKGEADKLLKESEALAGKRESLAASIHEKIKSLGFDKMMTDVKGWGFTYKVDKANPAELDVSYKTVALTTATVKAKKTGGGGNGKSAEEFGKSLSDIAAEFGTAEELAAIGAEGVSNSKSWQMKNVIKKRAIAAGQLKPVK